MPKRISLLIIHMLIYVIMYSQNEIKILTFDKGLGDEMGLSVGYKAMKKIFSNDVEGLLSLYKDTIGLDIAALKEEVLKVSKAYPHSDSFFPLSFRERDEREFYYERNICTYKGKLRNVVYLMQVFISLYQEGSSYYIANVEFRRNKAIKKREEEIDKIKTFSYGRPRTPPPLPSLR